jgi:hypothetical protein
MKFVKLNGFEDNKSVIKYLIKWDKKSRSKFQTEVKFFLRPFWKGQIVYEEFPVVGTKMTLDFVNLSGRIALEVQGSQHSEYNKFFHGEYASNYYNQVGRDLDKKRWCELNNLRLIEIHPKDLPLTKKFLIENDII